MFPGLIQQIKAGLHCVCITVLPNTPQRAENTQAVKPSLFINEAEERKEAVILTSHPSNSHLNGWCLDVTSN